MIGTAPAPDTGSSRASPGGPLLDLETVRKSDIADRDNIRYLDFRRTLKPRYWRVWLDVAGGYVALLVVALAVDGAQRTAFPAPWLSIPVGAALIGYCIAYLQLFVHEAAHWNVAPNRAANDLLANLLLCLPVGLNIKSYRQIHWDHHRFLGDTSDTEHSYFDALDLRYVFESLAGVRVLKVMASRRKALAADESGGKRAGGRGLDRLMLLLGMAFNAALLAGALWAGRYYVAVAWVAGLGVFFPFFAALRQLLEHRDELAPRGVDFHQSPHGKVTRIFRPGPVGSTLGAAGFNRHLLHHWDPQVSYTRLADVERFLARTDLADALRTTRTTYLHTFVRLFSAARGAK